MMSPQYATDARGLNLTNTPETTDYEWRFDDPVQRRLIGTGLLVVCVVGVLGNSLVIAAVSLTQKLQNVTNAFVSNLAVGDLLHCVFLPLMIRDLYQPIPPVEAKNGVVCAINGILTVLFLSVSVFSHALIAVTRYVMITRPRHTVQGLFTPCRVVLFIILIWTVSSVDPILMAAGVAPLGYNPKYGICSRDIRQPSSVILSSVRSIYTNLFSVVVVLFCYTKVFLFIKRHNQSALRRIFTSSSGGSSVASRKTLEEKGEFFEANKNSHSSQNQPADDTSCVITIKEAKESINGVMDKEQTLGGISPNDWNHTSTLNDIDDRSQAVSFTKLVGDRSSVKYHKGGLCDGDASKLAVAPVDDEAASPSNNFTQSSHSAWNGTGSSVPNTGPKQNRFKNLHISYAGIYSGEYDKTPNVTADSTSIIPLETDTNHLSTEWYGDVNMTCDQSSRYLGEESVCSIYTNLESYGYQQGASGNSTDHNRNYKTKRGSSKRSGQFMERPSAKKKEIDITKKLFIVVCVFFACISPYVFFVSMKSLERLLPYAALLLASSSCLNPVIYGMIHPQFQQTFYLMITCQISKISKPTRFLAWITRSKVKPKRNVVI